MPAERGDQGKGRSFSIKGLGVMRDPQSLDPDTLHEYNLTNLLGKGTRVRQALFGGGRNPSVLRTGSTSELRNALRITQNAQWFETGQGRATRAIADFTESERPTAKQFVSLVDTAAGQMLRNIPPDHFDMVDVIVGTHQFDQATRRLFDMQPVADSRTALVLEKNRVALLEQVMLRLIDHVPLTRTQFIDLERDEAHAILRSTLGDTTRLSSEERLLTRLSNTTYEIAAISIIASQYKDVEDRESARRMDRHVRELTGNLAQRFQEGGQLPTLVVQGADIGLPYDVIMGHPNTYHVPLQEYDAIVADFYLVEPQEVHRLPTINRQHAGYSINFNDDQVALPLRMFTDGSVDFGWPLLSAPHRTIDRYFNHFNARHGLLYLQCLFAALATDASAPPEIIEAETKGSGPLIKVMKEAVRRGERPMEVMSTVVIPRRIKMASRSWKEEDTQSAGIAVPRREHRVRAYARKLQEGFQRSDDNLALYLSDLRAGAIFPLRPEDDQAVREGTKSYIHPVTRGDPRVGRVVSQRAVLGPGASTNVLEGTIPDLPSEEPQA
jgi:hypothetical protein